jgi:hypothetical protein
LIPGADWSISAVPRSLSQAKLLAHLGGMLRDIYSDLIEEEAPEHLTQIVNRLKAQQTDHD